MIQITDIKRQNKEALKYILNLSDLKKSYANSISSMSFLSANNIDGMPHGTDVGNPTAQKAFILLDVEKQKSWIIAIELMERSLTENKKVFLSLRRQAEIMAISSHEQGRPDWIDYVQCHYADWYYNRHGVDSVPSRQTLFNWMNKIIETTVRIAISRGCYDLC
jgi:hypothetical protein